MFDQVPKLVETLGDAGMIIAVSNWVVLPMIFSYGVNARKNRFGREIITTNAYCAYH